MLNNRTAVRLSYLFLAVIFAGASLKAQDNVLEVVGTSSGTIVTPSGGIVDFTVGEAIIGSLVIGDKILTQGFHQPYLLDCNRLNLSQKTTCLDDNSYEVEILVEGGNTGALGYTIDAVHTDQKHQIYNARFTDGPYSEGDLLSYIVSLPATPQCEEYISVVVNGNCDQGHLDIEADLTQEGNLIEWNLNEFPAEAKFTLQVTTEGTTKELLVGSVAEWSGTQNFLHQSTVNGIHSYEISIKSGTELLAKSTTDLARISSLEDKSREVNVFPNPVADWANVQIENLIEEEVTVVIHSISGRQLYAANQVVANGTVRVSFAGFAFNTYLLSIATLDGQLIGTTKVQKEN